jgi:hypothetical protein
MMDSVLRMPGDHCMWCVEPSDVPCQLGCRKPRMPRDSFERWKMETTGVQKPHEMPDVSATPVSAADGKPLFRSPQDEDHEAAVETVDRIIYGATDLAPAPARRVALRIVEALRTGGVSERSAYRSRDGQSEEGHGDCLVHCVGCSDQRCEGIESPSRVGSVAVEDVRAQTVAESVAMRAMNDG